MEIEKIGILADYLDLSRYENVGKSSQRRNILFENYLEMVQKFFVCLRVSSEQFSQIIKNEGQEKNKSIIEFEQFIKKITMILKETSIFQIDCITELKMSRQGGVQVCWRQICEKLPFYGKQQQNFKKKQLQVESMKTDLKKNFLTFKNQSNEALKGYNVRMMIKNSSKILDQLDQFKMTENALTTIRDNIISNSAEFQSLLARLKKKLLANKYQVLEGLIFQSRHFRNCLAEIVIYLLDCVSTNLASFQEHLQAKVQPKRIRKGSIDSSYSITVQYIDEYYASIDNLSKVLNILDSSLKNLNIKFRQNLQANKNGIMQNLNLLFTIEENPSKQITQTLDLFEILGGKLAAISDSVYTYCAKLTLLKSNVKKHSEVTLSMMKISHHKGKTGEQGRFSQLEQLQEQLSHDYLTDVMLGVYRSFKENLLEIKNYITSKHLKKKKLSVEDSMEVSHLEQTAFTPKKRPCKYQYWLWKDWREKDTFDFQSSNQCLDEMTKFLKNFKEIPESPQLKSYECYLVAKKTDRGVLKVCQNYLSFRNFSQNGQYELIIPFVEIMEISVRVQVFEKVLVIETEKGDLVVQKIQKVGQVRQFILQKIGAANMKGGKVTKKISVSLSPEEKQFLAENRQKRQQLRPKYSEMNQFGVIFIDNMKIDEFYDLIYSDKPFDLYGKVENTFFGLISKKSKNYNFTTTKWDHEGPQFYSQNPQKKFHNTPFSSKRSSEQEHKLPYIPFFPSSCKCVENSQIFWVSDQEFDYYSITDTIGVPYADSFNAQGLHRVKVKQNGIQCALYGGIFFHKQTSMKSILKSTSQKQLSDGMVQLKKQLQKAGNIYVGRKAGGNQENGQQKMNADSPYKLLEQDQEQVKSKQKMNLIQILEKNKMIILYLFFGYLLNSLFRAVF